MSRVLAWTGGQYSLFRAIFGGYLAIHFAQLLPWSAETFSSAGMIPDASASPLARLFPNVFLLCDAPGFVATLFALAVVAGLLLAIGAWDRIAALFLWYLCACLLGRNPLTNNPGLPYVGWMLVAHALIPGAPYGSWKARGRVDPDGCWRFPWPLFVGAWILMALGYGYSGITKLAAPSWVDGSAIARVLENPLARPTWLREALLGLPEPLLRVATWSALAAEIAFPLLALFARTRCLAWLLLLAMHFGLLTLVDFADLSFGMVMLHLFTFDPAWLKPKPAGGAPDHVFYDGSCGLCHRAVRFVLAEDRAARFLFSPLQGATIRTFLDDARRATLPDSMVVRAGDGRLLMHSDAWVHMLRGLGGAWRGLGGVVRLVPRPLRDGVYHCVARVRRRLFAAPKDACPLLPKQLRERFVP
jgi:predicted DCC family thiol-disulfide oxidoreductase YuxK